MSDGFSTGRKWADVFAWAHGISARCGVKLCDLEPHPLDKPMGDIIQLVSREAREVEVNKLLGAFCQLLMKRVEAELDERSARRRMSM